ncbi:hypothetical protein ELQ88_33925 [Pseudomonas sp. MPC6]|nr:hypothetical protein BZ163_21480 [Pseudomonas sp. VI4.1]QCY15375.1 hypothetical protein ELQ88_33925 [Pseudomonas sp. MPC6]
MIRADSFLLHEKSKTPPEKGGVFTSLDGLRRTRTLSQLNKYTSEGRPRARQRGIAGGRSRNPVVMRQAWDLRWMAWTQITRRRSSSAERHSRMSST